MYFSIGAHEAYACPGGIEEYTVCFDKPQTLSTCELDGNFINNNKINIITDSKTLPLKKEYFEVDALVFDDIKFDTVTLIKNDGSRRIKVEFPGFRVSALWTVPNADLYMY